MAKKPKSTPKKPPAKSPEPNAKKTKPLKIPPLGGSDNHPLFITSFEEEQRAVLASDWPATVSPGSYVDTFPFDTLFHCVGTTPIQKDAYALTVTAKCNAQQCRDQQAGTRAGTQAWVIVRE